MFSEIIIAAVVVGLVSVAMGFILVAIDKIVNNYGELGISINGGKKVFRLMGGNKLLTSLADQEIYLPSACGGRGSCGACKCRVTSDIGPHLPTELPWLNAQEQADGVRLACQVKVKQDLQVEIPEGLFNIRRLRCKVEKITDLTPDIKEVVLALPEGVHLEYEAGQYGQIEVPPYGEIRESTQRAYSFASQPSLDGRVEFVIRLVPGGAVTSYVHQLLRTGQDLNIVAPMGDFKVRPGTATMVCLAGGSGMAPFKSIFRDMEEKGQLEERDVWYFFGAHADSDQYYMDWLNELQSRHPRFHYIPSLTTPNPEGNWQGEVGRVTAILDRHLKGPIGSSSPREGYLCGSPGLIDSCLAVMQANGIAASDIFFDKFA